MMGLWWQAVIAIVGVVYALSLPFSGWLVWEAHRARQIIYSDPIVNQKQQGEN